MDESKIIEKLDELIAAIKNLHYPIYFVQPAPWPPINGGGGSTGQSFWTCRCGATVYQNQYHTCPFNNTNYTIAG